MAIKPDFNKIYQSNSFGPYRILEYTERVNSRKMVVIEFLETGCRKVVREEAAVVGAVKDDLYGIDFNKIYYSNLYGPFKIIQFAGRNEEGRRLVRIQFLNTGNEKIITHKAAMLGYAVDSGALKDPLDPTILDNQDAYIYGLLKGVWKNMVSRCNNINDPQYKFYGALGVRVCDEWSNRDNFLISVRSVLQFDKYYNNPYGYQLDKDYLQQDIPKNLRIYSPQTCIFLSNQDNKNLSIIERNKISNNIYYGVELQECGTYRVMMHINGEYKNIGTFTDLIAAANAFNYFQLKHHEYELVPLLNNVPYMTPYEFYSYRVGGKNMVKIIK